MRGQKEFWISKKGRPIKPAFFADLAAMDRT
jgi:hypothetical protein